MQKTGTITNIVPDGGYQGQDGYINTFQMSIQCADGLITGQIGTKAQVYPVAIGQDIIVEIANTQHGVRFKKINPKYANQGQQQNYQQQSPQQAPQQPQSQGRDYDKENRGKCRFGFYQALLRSGATAAQLADNMEELLAIEKLVDMSMLGIESAQKKAAIANAMPNDSQPVSDEDIPY